MRFELKILGVDRNGFDTDWYSLRTYKTMRSAEQGMNDMKHQFGDRKWKIRDKNDNSESIYGANR